MMRARPRVAATLVPLLLLATPAAARGPHRHAARAALPPQAQPLIGRPLRLTREEAAAAAARSTPRQAPEATPLTMLGSWPVLGDVNLGVGLFSVMGATEKEQMRRRADPMRDLKAAETRVAAVGFNLRF